MMLRPAALALSVVALACTPPNPAPEPVSDDVIVSFAPVGPETFLTEPDPGGLDRTLRDLLHREGVDDTSRDYSNRWVQPPGWTATVEAFGEPLDTDLYARRGYRYRTNLVHPESGVVVFAYTKSAPGEDVWKPQQNVRVSGRLEGYSKRAPGLVILLDARLESGPVAREAAPS